MVGQRQKRRKRPTARLAGSDHRRRFDERRSIDAAVVDLSAEDRVDVLSERDPQGFDRITPREPLVAGDRPTQLFMLVSRPIFLHRETWPTTLSCEYFNWTSAQSAWPCESVDEAHREMHLDYERMRALERASYIYLTTYSASGKPGTVPTWLWPHDGAVYFTTKRASLKARRIRNNGRVTVRIGAKDGPAFEGRAEWVDDRPDLEAALLAAYRRKYWLTVPLFMGRYIRKGLTRKTSVLIRITPTPPSG
jgi:PPOX class probable F420-dependent enzyme